MTIDELLTTARYWIGAAQDKETPLDESAQCAQIAQACALTAQAMILHSLVTATEAGKNQETYRPALRVFGDFYQPHP